MTPRIFLALHVYTPPSCDVTSQIISPPRDCTTRLFKGLILEFCFSHVTWGVGFPLTSHCNEAIPVSFTSMDTRRWHNRRSWDGFTRIALGSLRTLIAFLSRRPLISLSTFVSFRSLGSTRSGRTMLALGNRPFPVCPLFLSSSLPYRPGYSGPAGLLFWCRHDWQLDLCLIFCFYFLSCVCGDCVFLQLNNKHNEW